jgi:hypothetical protein
MKQCPYCAEQIQDAAIKCRFCGEIIDASAAVTVATPYRPIIDPSEVQDAPFKPQVAPSAFEDVPYRPMVHSSELLGVPDNVRPGRIVQSAGCSVTPERSQFSRLAIVLILAGAAAVIYFAFGYDTSVEVPTTHFLGQEIGGGRVQNIGRLSERQNGIIGGFGVTVVGILLEIVRRSRR